MTKNIVIVESPAKAKTIKKFLGNDFDVTSCYGHIRDLAPNKMSVDVEKNYEPQYQIPSDKKKLVKELKQLVKDAEQVWLATDEDREGEAISWHLKKALDLNENQINRIVFHEITKQAIKDAIENPRKIDKKMVEAQQARRILDRLVGFELSPVLWKKVQPALSAGRVQSVAVRLIVEREREINDFKPENFFRVSAELHPVNDKGAVEEAVLKAELPHKYQQYEDAKKFIDNCNGSSFHIESIEKKPAKRKPSPPFTTSTLQQEAGRKLGFSVSRTMTLAQKLYEAGHITYMRTDSISLSDEARNTAEDEIRKTYGDKYAKPRQYQTKNQSAQEAHEAIRPTSMNTKSVKGDGENKLYDLIYKRTLASQMADAELEKTNVKIGISNSNEQLTAKGEVVKFDGFLKVYIESFDDEEEKDKGETLLPPIKEGQQLSLDAMRATERFTKPPARYTEASLVKKLEELGIGRPSTYAPTISTIQKRGYVTKTNKDGQERNYKVIALSDGTVQELEKTETYGVEKGKIFPTNTGMVVNDFLTEYFSNIVDYNFTATVEKQFDEIASGSEDWHKMIDNFYTRFHSIVEDTEKNTSKFKGERYLGKDPSSGNELYVKLGKYGGYVQKGSNEGDEKPEFAKLREGQLIENITLEQALELFKLPRHLGDYQEHDVAASVGRYGPYIRHGSKFYSLPQEDDPYTVTYDRAIEIIEEKKKEEAKKNINTFEYDGKELRVLNGPYGPYISYNKQNYKIPKDYEAHKLTLDDCIKILEDPKNQSKKKRKGGGNKKTSKKSS